MGAREPRPSLDEAGVERHRLLVSGDRPAEARGISSAHPLRRRLAAQEGVVGCEVLRRLLRQLPLRAVAQRHIERLRHSTGNVGLDLEHVGERRIEGCLPLRCPGRDLHQLRAHVNAARCAGALLPPHSARQEILHTELLPDLLGRLRCPLIPNGAAARCHLQAGKRRQLAADFVRDSVGEVLVRGCAQVL